MAAEAVQLIYHNQSNVYGLGHGAPELASFIQDTPYSGVEAILNDHLIAEADEQDPRLPRTVRSLHASFNGGYMSPYGFVASMQHVQRQGRTLELVQTADKICPGMPVVGFEEHLDPESEQFIMQSGGLFIVQPKANHYEAIGRQTRAESLLSRDAPLGSIAISGFALDNMHLSNGLSEVFVDKAWRSAAQSGRTYEAHISTNRWDLAIGAGRETRALMRESRSDYFTMLESVKAARDTRLGKMIMELINNWEAPIDQPVVENVKGPVLPLVFETAPDNPFVLRKRHIRFGEQLVAFIEQNTDARVVL